MARRVYEQDSGGDRSKVKLFYAEAEGTNQSLQDLVRAMPTARSRPVPGALPPRRAADNSEPSGKTPPDPTLFQETQETPSVSVDGDRTPAEPPLTTTRRRRGEGAKRDRNAGLAIVKSLNLRPKGKESLKDFVASKKPQIQMEHIAVYVYYLKRVLEEPNVGFSHIFTCFKEVEERLPEDLPQTCRNTANQKGWVDTSSQDDLKITTRGDNLVEHELPRAEDAERKEVA